MEGQASADVGQGNSTPTRDDEMAGGDGEDRSLDEECKLFVGGLSWETTEQNLRNHFGKYGEVLECNVKMDTATNKSRGFGFVLFSTPECVKKVLCDPEPHIIDGKKVDAKRAVPHLNKGPVNPRARKVFVGALHESLDETALKEHFGQFGKVGDIDFPTDKATNKRRGFCFVALENEEQVAKAAEKRFHEIRGYTVEVKFAVPKEEESGGQGDWNSGRLRGMGGNRDQGPGGFNPYFNYFYPPSSFGYYNFSMNSYGYPGYPPYSGGGSFPGYYERGTGNGAAGMGGMGGDPYQGQDYSSYGPMRSSSSQYGGNPQFRPY